MWPNGSSGDAPISTTLAVVYNTRHLQFREFINYINNQAVIHMIFLLDTSIFNYFFKGKITRRGGRVIIFSTEVKYFLNYIACLCCTHSHVIIELRFKTVPFELNIISAHSRKSDKYSALVSDIESVGYQCFSM